MNPGRLRALAGAMAAITLVVLFALLLRGVAASRTSNVHGVGGSPTTPPTVSPTASGTGQWQTYQGLIYTTTLAEHMDPAIAPTDPATVYVATLNPFGLKRTTDEGAHWTNLTLPGNTSSLEDIQVFVSPLDAQVVFVALTSPLPPGASQSACPTLAGRALSTQSLVSQAWGSSWLSARVPSGGSIFCTQVYESRDGGGHWQQPSLPGPGVIQDLSPLSDQFPQGHVLQSQGTRLFALMGCGPLCAGPVTDLIRSDDGGTTWHLADGDIRNAGDAVCDFAPSPSGGDIYAITTAGGCSQMTVPPEDLWHSPDGGAHWSHVGALSTSAAFGMAVVPQAGGAPLLYIHMPPGVVQGHGTSISYGLTNLHASSDGGKTWHAAPSAGIPDGWSPPSLPMGVLSDGTVIESFKSPYSVDGSTTSQASQLYGWKLGESAWQPVAPKIDSPTLDGGIFTLVTVPDSSGVDTLWAALVLSEASATNTVTVGIESYQI
jgi:hypothetical protein